MIPQQQSWDKSHGRGELRKTYICQDLSFLDACQNWPGLNTLVTVESTRITKLKTSLEYRFYISSLVDTKAEIYHKLVTNHWSIENQLHYEA